MVFQQKQRTPTNAGAACDQSAAGSVADVGNTNPLGDLHPTAEPSASSGDTDARGESSEHTVADRRDDIRSSRK